MGSAFVLLPNQLFKKLPGKRCDRVVLIEEPRIFTDFKFHKKKLVFHRASMQCYCDLLKKKKYDVAYMDIDALSKRDAFAKWLKREQIARIVMYDPVDHVLKKKYQKLAKSIKAEIEYICNPSFFCSGEDVQELLGEKKHYSMNSFYIAQRKRLEILLDGGKPVGGKWSFDRENREKLQKGMELPAVWFAGNNKYVKDACMYVRERFGENPGDVDRFFYPVTHRDAEKWLVDFIEHRLDLFGPYEDAICENEDFLFHSLLSPLLNAGLLLPGQVIEKVLQYSQEHGIRLNSLEGFVRQVIGWREFVRGVYMLEGETQRKRNFWKFRKTIPRAFYDGTTGIEPVDCVIGKVRRSAYCHHIERLMILGNFMLLCEIDPNEVYRWFMEMFVDAYDWVMVPNVFGMSQYADGGVMVTKPYISSSNYVRKMSDFKKGDWCAIWDGLFWRFIWKHKDVFASNPRMKMMIVQANKKGQGAMREYCEQAEHFLKML